MVYDPQRDQPRYRPSGNGSSVVDTLLDPVIDPPQSGQSEPPPAPGPGIAAEPPNAWSERLLYSVGISTVLGAAAGLLVLRLLWKAWRRRSR
ncbi:MAG: hypothetical protein F4110_10930 [Acidimicrobiaceae bacterium]|nr:hypothetical protein [Acidimicrobiaceae bacterium]MXZ97838.1 hypothetical protein [Acidimicrobiaceae bacterium]MYE77007.1 hypothetical protein [Acidimicrobiaceae bacterium]MYE97231.1 hypothetical protein [Acidimicrobiaceae bacterium]MYH44951.1 hypothetical protein [Acidimicrobiaceae bacterium]